MDNKDYSFLIALTTAIAFLLLFALLSNYSDNKMQTYCKNKGYDVATDGYAYPIDVVCSNISETIDNGRIETTYINSKHFKENE